MAYANSNGRILCTVLEHKLTTLVDKTDIFDVEPLILGI